MNRKKPRPLTGTLEPAPDRGATNKLLKRSEAARLLGVSVSTLRRKEGDLIQPVIDADGFHRFAESELRAVMVTVRHRQAVASMGPNAGDVAAEVFTLLDEQLHPAEIVKRLRLPPDVVMALHEQWAHMHEAFLVTKEEAVEIARHVGVWRATSGPQAVAQIKARVETLLRLNASPQCKRCGDRSACICEPCVLAHRGVLCTMGVKLERRTDDEGVELVRVVASAGWDETVGVAAHAA